MENKRYNGKIILFGEYSMIFGSDALLMPYYSVHGEWSSIINRPSWNGVESNKNLFKFHDYLCEDDRFRILDLKRFEMELNAGLYFDSNIPSGYGVGSSGALVAAIYDRYKLTDIEEVSKLKDFLAKMENFFHGNSSGIDPLQCYYGRPFIIGQQAEIKMLKQDFISEDIHIFLIDTKIKSPTGPLVNRFKELRNDNVYLDKFDNKYVPLISECIDSLTDKKDDSFFDNLFRLSVLQTELLSHTIPHDFKKYFLTNINDEGFQVKLCGAGGGGYLLGFSQDIDKTNRYWENIEQNIIWIK